MAAIINDIHIKGLPNKVGDCSKKEVALVKKKWRIGTVYYPCVMNHSLRILCSKKNENQALIIDRSFQMTNLLHTFHVITCDILEF